MNEKTRNRVWKWSLIGLFGAVALALAAGGYALYRHEVQTIRSKRQSELKAIAELKVDQIVHWRSERASDARVHSRRVFLRAAVDRWSKSPVDASWRTQVEENMELLRTSYGYEDVIVAGRDGSVLFSLSPRLPEREAEAEALVARAVRARDPVFGDLVRCSTCGQVHWDVAAPIRDVNDRPVAVLILRSDPESCLFPLVQSWPTPSRSAETLLVRKEGEAILFLNKLRHAPDPALTRRVPLSRTDLPAVQAALGKVGEFEGWDYRGVKVLAEVLPVPGTPWFLVAKVDSDEILAEARHRGQFILIFTALSMLVTGATAAFVFSARQKDLYRNLYRAERGRRQVEEEIRATFYSIGDGVISTDAAGRVTRMNPVAERLTGWSEAEALGRPSQQVFHIVNEQSRAEVENPVARVLREGVVVNLANHTLLLCRDGTECPIADSGAPIRDEKGRIVGAVLVFRDQTDERRAEEALRESREQFRSIVSAAQDAIIMIDPQGCISLWNQSAERIFGYSVEEALGQYLHRLLAPARLREAYEKGFGQFVRSGEGAAVGKVTELPALHKDGREFPIELSLASVPLHGQWHAVGVVRDISERKRAEQALGDSETRHRTLFESSADAVMTLAPPSWKFTCGNPATLKMFGVKDEAEFISLGPWNLSPERQPDGQSSAEKAKEMIETAMREGSHFFEWTHRRLNGDDFPATVLLTRMELAGRALLQATVRDISEQKQAAERQARFLKWLEGVNQLREELLLPGSPEDKTKRITEAAVDLLDLDFCRIWRVKPSDLCEAGCIHAGAAEGPHVCRDRDRCLHLESSSGRYTHVDGDHRRVPFGAYKIGRIATGQDVRFVTNNVTTDPRVHNHEWAKGLGLVSFAGYKLRGANGQPIGVLAAFAKHELSEEDDALLCDLAETTSKVIWDTQVQAELREKTKQAMLATRAKSEFLANMSHEIRTPMTAILGYTDLLMDESLSAADRKNHLTTVRRNAEHLLQLINDILDLSKIESGKMVMEPGPCHLASTVADVASMMRPRAEQSGNTLEVRYTGPVPEIIHTDTTRLRQVIVNLVGNAAKFTENGSIRIGVSFLPQWRSDGSAVSVQVIDTGIGISQEAQTRLFQPFTQAETSTTRKYGGTGLGLAISRKIVAALGGELTVESTPGEGSTFTVTIPTGDISGVNLVQSFGEVICEDEAGARWTPGVGVLQGVRILLAEDSVDNQELLRIVLGNAGAEVEVVENGRLAIERAQASAFDVVLMDMNMPEMDGYEATRRLRDGGYARPILALTANAMSGDGERCLAAGCDAHLAKPIDRKQLVEAVAQYAVPRTGPAEAPRKSPAPDAPPGPRDGISSQFADDPQLAAILPGFVERLPGQLEALCKALEEERLEDAERVAHRLKGAGGGYGYPALSEAAKSLELALKAQDMGGATTALANVKGVCTAIQAGWSDRKGEATQP